MESNIFKDAFTSSLFSNNDLHNNEPITINITSSYNVSEIIIIENDNNSKIINYFDDLNEEGKKERNKYNEELFEKVITYWIIFLLFTILISLIELSIKFYLYKKRKKEKNFKKVSSVSNLTVEMIELSNLNNNQQMEIKSDEDKEKEKKKEKEEAEEEEYFFQYHKINKDFFLKGAYYIILSLSIILFEYLFFNFIILKYHVISKKEIEYLLYKLLFPTLTNYIQII